MRLTIVFLLLILLVLPLQAQPTTIDINTADHLQLTELGFSPLVIKRIEAFRTLIGPIKTMKDLQAIKGIGKGTVKKIKSLVSFSDDEKTVRKLETSFTTKEILRADKIFFYRPDTKLNINTAGPDDLVTLPGIREGRAQAIILHRTQKGPFTDIQQLMDVQGITKKVFKKMEKYLEVGDGKTITVLADFQDVKVKHLLKKPTDTSATPAVKGDGKLHVHLIDVGQGDAIMIITPKGYVTFIDAAEKHTMRDAVIPYMKELNITHVNSFVLTHAHSDHAGGASKFLTTYKVDKVYDSGYPATTITYMNFLKSIEKKSIPYFRGREGSKIDTEEGVRQYFLHPHSQILAYGTHSDENMNSSVMKLEFGNFSMLFTGDIESDTEERLVKLHKDEIRSTILKAPHHGGEFSSTLPFLQAVGAKAVVISVGAGNSFNHPHEDTLAKYRQLKSKIYRTDLAGHLHIISDGKTWSIKQQFPKGKDAPTKAEKESHKPKPTSKINVNTADIPTLASIPLVGIRTAEKIHALRTEKGNFETLEGLTKVRGIGKKLLSRIRPYITISDEEESVTEMK